MRSRGRPSIFRYLLLTLVGASVLVTLLLLLATQAVRQATQSLEDVVVLHVRPLASAQRLQSKIDTLRGLELELQQFDDFFAVPYQLDNMERLLDEIDGELASLRPAMEQIQPLETRRLVEHWQIYHHAVRDEIRLAREMDLAGVARISTTRSRGAHNAISDILGEMIVQIERASTAAYHEARDEARAQETLLATTLAVGLLLLFLTLWQFGRSVSRRIRALDVAAHAVAHGEQFTPIQVTGNDELADLGRAFNTMQSKVAEREDELRAAYERLEQRAQTAEEATLAKSQFLANMSHEIRTPMNGVLGMLDILRETRMNPEQQDYLATAHHSANALLDLLNDILDLSKIEAGKVRLERIQFDLEQVIDDSIALHADRAHAKGIDLKTALDPTLPSYLYGDPGRLRQVLNNLLSNAVKFTRSGEIALEVKRVKRHDGPPLMRVEISDTGTGIPRDKQEEIFEAFTQADGSTTRRFGGTGLGLTISSELVRAMGGEIGVESAPGQGSRFWFTLPLDEATMSDERKPPGLAGARVLVVVGDGAQRDQLVRRLESWHCHVRAVANADELAEAGNGGHLSCKLALLSGALRDPRTVATIGEVHAAMPGAKVVLLTPPGQPCREEDLDTYGIDHCLSWPLRKSQLRNAMQQLLVAPRPPASEHPTPGGRELNVLVAEDNLINQKVAISMLRKLGCTVDIAGNGHEALERYRGHRYDLIFMDCQMPGIDGFEVTEEIRRIETPGTTRVPIVAMTAHAMPSDRDRCLEAGMDDYLSKPISVEQLRSMLARWGGPGPESGVPEFREGTA